MKRFGVVFILFIMASGLVIAPAAHAFNPLPSAEEMGTIVDDAAKADQSNKEIYTVNSQALQLNSFVCLSIGCSRLRQSVFYYGNSPVAQITNGMMAMYTHPPADLMAWVHMTAQDLGFEPKSAYAQGIGFTGLSALLPLWRAFRNISYALLAVIMVVIGFMVMFRKKIDPKTVVTVQNALPKIVLSLLLITFSYAIAAFFIDLMYLSMAIVINLIVGASGGALGADTASKYISGNLGTVFNAMFGGGLAAIDDAMRLLFWSGPVPWYVNAGLAVATLGLAQGAMLILTFVIVAVALLFGIVRIAFMLVGAYIQILLAVLMAPFQLMTEALPGSTGFSSWLKNLIVNLLVFPITAAMLLIGTILTKSNTNGVWAPPLLSGGGTTPATPGGGITGITGIIGLGILLAIPTVVNSVKESLKAKAPVEAGLGAIFGPLGAGAGQAMQLVYQGSYIASAFRPHTEPGKVREFEGAGAKPENAGGPQK